MRHPILYGDATQETFLEHANTNEARLVVIAIYDPVAIRQIVQSARELSPKAHVIPRTRFISEVESLYAMGADEIIPAELKTAVISGLVDYLSLKASYTIKYDNQPVPSTLEETDTVLAITLVVNF